jgi:pimeloyl-ACP methyl ester carboxylesterase
MDTVTSTDGTSVAYEVVGEGEPLILIGGAFNVRQSPWSGIPLARGIAGRTVYAYDRRGRGDSGDRPPFATEREVEDIAALIDRAGGAAGLFGHSSGAALALRAAAGGGGGGVPDRRVTSVALFEPPFTAASRADAGNDGLAAEIDRLVTAGDRSGAVELFQRSIGIPAEVVEQMRDAPFRPALEAIAHTLVYDLAAVGTGVLPVDLLQQVDVPALVVVGGASPEPLQAAARAVADALPDARLAELEGTDHGAGPELLAPALTGFFAP